MLRPKIGLLTGAYFEYWKMYPGLDKEVEKDMKRLYEKLSKKVDVVWSGLADTIEKTEEAGRKFRQEDVDLLVICEGTYFPDYMPIQTIEYLPDVPILILLIQPQDTIPLDMDYQGSITHSFGLVGTVQLTGAFSKMGKKFEIIVGALDDDSICEGVEQYARVVSARKRLRFLRLGIVGHTFQGMYDLELDKTELKSQIGPSIIYVEMAELLSIWKDIQKGEMSKLADEMMAKYKIDGPNRKDIESACQLSLAMQKLVEKYNLDGFSHLCQFLIHVETKTTPCLGTARLIQSGIMATCEGDIGNLVAMCILHLLSGSTVFFGEWGMYDVKENAMLIFHHGAGNPDLSKDPSSVNITPTGEKWGFEGKGASFRFMGRPGEVTITSLIYDKEGWKMLISGGEAIDAPCRPTYSDQFMIRVNLPVKEYLEQLCRHGVTHHVVLCYGDIRKELCQLADLLGIMKFIL